MSDALDIEENRIVLYKADLPITDAISHSDVTIHVRGAITKVEFEDNEDGTYDRVHKFKAKFVEVVTENGDIIKSKDTRTQGKLLKGQIEMIRRDKAPAEDEKVWYDRCMIAVRHNLSEILASEGII